MDQSRDHGTIRLTLQENNELNTVSNQFIICTFLTMSHFCLENRNNLIALPNNLSNTYVTAFASGGDRTNRVQATKKLTKISAVEALQRGQREVFLTQISEFCRCLLCTLEAFVL